MNLINQAWTTNFSWLQCPQNSSQSSSNNITNYQHCQNFISHQRCPSYTMTKRYNTSKMLQSQHYNMINDTMPQIPTRSHNNKMTTSQDQIFNSKSQIYSTSKFLHPQISNSKFSNSKFLNPKSFGSKLSIPNFQILNCIFQTLCSKFQNFKVSIFKISKRKIS